MDNSNTSKKMPPEIKRTLESLTTFQRKYAEYRARGMKQPDAALKAGSQANSRSGLGRVGYNTEQVKGIKEYINYLMNVRAEAAMVDSIEIVEKLRRVYDEAIDNNKFNDANKATELLGNMIGVFGTGERKAASSSNSSDGGPAKNNVNAFKEEGETVQERMKKIKNLIEMDKQ